MDGRFINKVNWKNLDHQVFHFLENLNLKSKKGLVCISGGVDSMALLFSLNKVFQAAGMSELSAINVHHGQNENHAFRNQASEVCKNFCSKIGVPFYFEENKNPLLKSENELREFRWSVIQKVSEKLGDDVILFTGHHRDDSFENLFIRLWRGTGPEGLVEFGFARMPIFRPFLEISKKQIYEYSSMEGIPFLEDPTNSSNEPLRNFIRNELFPLMESKVPGGIDAFSRSVINLTSQAMSRVDRLTQLIDPSTFSVSRAQFMALDKLERKAVVAKLHLMAGLSNYSAGQIEEIVRRLDKVENEYSFSLKYGDQTKVWVIDAKRIGLNLE